ncbi:hypothetical protein ZHAS_00013374 [Anopheles sinensis]|uniref:Uncharacterized protein n=1 Tax=Anopheles sinensis TaxID=74873 RepID=A0A084W5E6_ANOSI|nr:hypothetical protein ZHAS_00013374 [Anopheles sinensis]
MEPSELASVTSTGSVRKRAPSKRGETLPTQSTTTAATPITSQSEKKRLARLSRLYYDDFVTLDTTIMLKTYVRYIAKKLLRLQTTIDDRGGVPLMTPMC